MLQFHKSGKHYIDFRLSGEKRWLVMKKVAFYILERPVVHISREEGEFKDDGSSSEGESQLAPIEVSSNTLYYDYCVLYVYTHHSLPAPASTPAWWYLQEDWVYCEDISLEFAFAQSVLFKIFGNSLQETGHLTRGHTCLTDADRLNAQYIRGSLLYGELLPRGANKVYTLLFTLLLAVLVGNRDVIIN